MANNTNKKAIVARINAAAKKYKSKVVGNTFLIIYEGKYIELSFRAKNFLHLFLLYQSLFFGELQTPSDSVK